jgi:hypothetical protein
MAIVDEKGPKVGGVNFNYIYIKLSSRGPPPRPWALFYPLWPRFGSGGGKFLPFFHFSFLGGALLRKCVEVNDLRRF